MNTVKNKEKSCKNCRYYSQHFSKQETRIAPVCCGHCLHKEVKNYKRRPLELCEFWEDIAIKQEERKTSIKETLEFMAERLNEMAIILNDDKE